METTQIVAHQPLLLLVVQGQPAVQVLNKNDAQLSNSSGASNSGTNRRGRKGTNPSLDGTQIQVPFAQLDSKQQKKLTCNLCGETFSKYWQKLSHKRRVHLGIIRTTVHFERKHVCDICGKAFKRYWHKCRHKLEVHKVVEKRIKIERDPNDKDKVKSFVCPICGKCFSKHSLVVKHETTAHTDKEKIRRYDSFQCSECFTCFATKANIMLHFSRDHPNFVLQNEKLRFMSEDAFRLWKESVERNTASSYVKFDVHKTLRPSMVNVYRCHRSGKYRKRGRDVRKMKSIGSNKTGYYCPAQIRVETFENAIDGVVLEVDFQSTHIGHVCEVGRQRRPVFRQRDEITGKIKRVRGSTKLATLQNEFLAEFQGFMPKINECTSVEELKESFSTLCKTLEEKIELASVTKKRLRQPTASEQYTMPSMEMIHSMIPSCLYEQHIYM
jgi:hypothetical protein